MAAAGDLNTLGQVTHSSCRSEASGTRSISINTALSGHRSSVCVLGYHRVHISGRAWLVGPTVVVLITLFQWCRWQQANEVLCTSMTKLAYLVVQVALPLPG